MQRQRSASDPHYILRVLLALGLVGAGSVRCRQFIRTMLSGSLFSHITLRSWLFGIGAIAILTTGIEGAITSLRSRQRSKRSGSTLASSWSNLQRDRVVMVACLVALTASLIGWALLCSRYTGLPTTIILRFDPLGRTLGPRPRAAILLLPVVGLLLQPMHIGFGLLLLHRRLVAAAQFVLLALASFEILLTSALVLICLR